MIQAHPARASMAEHLQRLLGRPRVPIVYDPEPDAPRDTWRSNRRAWQYGGGGAWTHRLLLQEDIIPCVGFREAAVAAVAAADAPLLCLFVSEQLQNLAMAMQSAAAAGEHWAWGQPQGFVPMQALAMRRDQVADMLAWTSENPHPGQQPQYPWLSRNGVELDPREHRLPNDDEIVARWARERRLPLCATVPSLVEHDTGVRSLIGNDHHGGRRAACLVPDGVDASSLRW